MVCLISKLLGQQQSISHAPVGVIDGDKDNVYHREPNSVKECFIYLLVHLFVDAKARQREAALSCFSFWQYQVMILWLNMIIMFSCL